jgi:hypothetical protein
MKKEKKSYMYITQYLPASKISSGILTPEHTCKIGGGFAPAPITSNIAPQVLTSLRILLMMKPSVVHNIARHIAYGLHDLLRTNAANIHTGQDWFTLFTLLEVIGGY